MKCPLAESRKSSADSCIKRLYAFKVMSLGLQGLKEEDIVDGFVFESFESFEDLEVSSLKRLFER